MDRMFILNQAFEESRYHRRFHHTVYTLFITVYIALLGFQISFPSHIEAIRGQTVLAAVFAVCILALIPLYVGYIIVHYHKRIAVLNSLIANLRESQGCGIQLPEEYLKTLSEGLDALLFAKYKDVLANGQNPMFKGHGHWLFLITFALIVLCDIFSFALVSAP